MVAGLQIFKTCKDRRRDKKIFVPAGIRDSKATTETANLTGTRLQNLMLPPLLLLLLLLLLLAKCM